MENIQLNASAGATISAGGVTPGSGTITVTPGDDPTQGGSVDVNYLPGTGTVSGSAEIAAVPDFGGLTSSVNGINSQLTMLNGAVNGMVGTLAGENTVFVVMKDNACAETFCQEIREML